MSGELTSDDKMISTLPDWKRPDLVRHVKGVVGWIDPRTGKVH